MAAPQNAATQYKAKLNASVTSLLAASDASANGRVDNLSLIHKARLASLKRTATALRTQTGADPDEVRQAEAAVTSSTQTAARVEILSRQISTPAPTVSAKGWTLQGRVYDSALKPVKAFTVFLVDAQKTYQRQYGFAYTDATGLFVLAAETADPKDTTQLYLEVANAKGQPVYLSPTPFVPTLSSATYKNITLPAGNKPLGDLPSELHASALPTQEAK